MAASRKSVWALKDFLDEKVARYNTRDFITSDPISIPHQFTKTQDIEIAGFFAATFAWGQRVTIINKGKELLALMDNSPHEFLLHHQEQDLKRFENFKHRTFNATDALYFIESLSHYYKKHASLEEAFLPRLNTVSAFPMEEGLVHFHETFFSLPDYPHRTLKHVSSPANRSACKRLNMFLRWMVRHDTTGVDLGIWKRISPSQLICPCDVHVERVARKLKLIRSKPLNWQTAIELTAQLRLLDPLDPVKYDFALFGLGVVEHF
jgi:uncharacterized protein (TIGR02757 family)